MQIAEEEALFMKMQQDEQRRLMEAESNKNRTLPPHSPNSAQGTAGTAAGGGGVPHPLYSTPGLTQANILVVPSPISGSAPVNVNFANNSPLASIVNCDWTWLFGDGTVVHKDIPNPTHLYQTGSFTWQVTGSNRKDGASFTASGVITCSLPVAAPSFAPTATTGSVHGGSGLVVNFSNGTPLIGSANQVPNTYNWVFSGSTTPVTPVTASTLTNPSITFFNTGSYFVTLGVTGSYGVKGSVTFNAVNAIT